MRGKVICKLLNVRKAPEKGDNVITTIKRGTELLILDDAGKWLKVNTGDVEGYVMAEFVELEQAKIDENGNFTVDGKVIGHVDGDDIVITDKEVIKETLKDAEPPKQEAEDQQEEKTENDQQTDAEPPKQEAKQELETPEEPEKTKKKAVKKDEQAGSAK